MFYMLWAPGRGTPETLGREPSQEPRFTVETREFEYDRPQKPQTKEGETPSINHLTSMFQLLEYVGL